jgi:hypothetical protein
LEFKNIFKWFIYSILLIFCYYLIIGLYLGLWICAEINTYLSFNYILIWAAGYVLRLRYIRWKAQIRLSPLFKLYLIVNVRYIPRFVYALQCSCLRANTRADVFLWISGQWRLQDSCRWLLRRLRLPPPDRTTALASSHHGESFYGIRSAIHTVNHAVH